MKKCPYCGGQNEDDQTLCTTCGANLEGPPPVEPVEVPTEAAVEVPVEVPMDAPAEAPKKSVKKLWVAIIAGVLVVALALVSLFLIRNLTDPMRKIKAAEEKTTNALEEQLEKLPNLMEMRSYGQELEESMQYAMDMNMTVDVPDMDGITFGFSMDYDAPNKLVGGELSLGIADVGSVSGQFAMNNEMVQVGSSQVLGDTLLQGEMQEILKLINEANDMELFDPEEEIDLFKQQDDEGGALLEAWEKDCVPALEDFIDTIKPEEVGTSTVGTHTWTQYRMAGDEEKRQAFVDHFKELIDRSAIWQQYETIPGLPADAGPYYDGKTMVKTILLDIMAKGEFTVSLDERGYFVACDVTNDGTTASIRLEGEKNPWEKIVVSSGDMLSCTIEMDAQNGTLTGSLQVMGENDVDFTYTDATGEYTFTMDDEELTMVFGGTLKKESEGLSMTIGVEVENVKVSADAWMKPLTEAPTMLTGTKTLDMLNMSEEETQELTAEIQQNLMKDGDILALLMYFYGM